MLRTKYVEELFWQMKRYVKDPYLTDLIKAMQEIPGDPDFRKIIVQLTELNKEEKRKLAKARREAIYEENKNEIFKREAREGKYKE